MERIKVVKCMVICPGIIIILLLLSLILFINLNILDIDVFSPAGNQHRVNIYSIIIITLRNKKKVILYYAYSLYL